jgi:hypothetical protein
MADLDPTLVRLEAERRIRRAMDHVEHAQRELELACQDLCDIKGALPLWTALGVLGNRVHAAWGRLARFVEKGRYDLDGLAREAFARRLPRGEGASR